jgi:hypothetical protein
MMPSRGMGAIAPSKMPKKKVIRRKDDPNDVDMYAEGGKVKAKYMKFSETGKPVGMAPVQIKKMKDGGTSKVNEAGNYTKPGMRKALFNKIKGQATQGTAAGQWSARKAQLLAKQYKAKGGGYRG